MLSFPPSSLLLFVMLRWYSLLSTYSINPFRSNSKLLKTFHDKNKCRHWHKDPRSNTHLRLQSSHFPTAHCPHYSYISHIYLLPLFLHVLLSVIVDLTSVLPHSPLFCCNNIPPAPPASLSLLPLHFRFPPISFLRGCCSSQPLQGASGSHALCPHCFRREGRGKGRRNEAARVILPA